MSGFRNPVGDEPPQTYWRRRLIVVAGGVLVILVLWVLVSATLSGDGGSNDSPANPDPTMSPTTEPAVDNANADSPDRPCTDADLTVSAVASPTSITKGSSSAFDVSIEHTGSSPCALSSNADGTSLKVRSGEDVYYDSAWCADTPVFSDAQWILQPGDREALQASWTSKRYNESCEAGGDGAAGTYRAAIAVGGVAAEEAIFTIVE